MPVFNVAGLNPALRKKSGGGGVGVLSDQLTMLENELAKDGYLSPGDYDTLIEKAREIQSSGSLTTDQVSNYSVRISTWERQKSEQEINNQDDISGMDSHLKSEAAEDVIVSGNNPEAFLKGRTASLQAKLNQLDESIDRRSLSGRDYADLMNEYNDTLRQFSSKVEALDALSQFDGNNPISGYAAYVTTNNNGEIVDVDIDRVGSQSGFVETNGMMDGVQVYGKVNNKRDGRNFFLLGDAVFSAVDMLQPDPENPGSLKPTRLVSGATQRGGIAVGEAGFTNIPGATIQTQSYIPKNAWARGVNGTLYNRREDGGYTKYLNTPEQDLPIGDSPILNMPDVYERTLMSKVDETVDGSEPIIPDEGTQFITPDESGLSVVQAEPGQEQLGVQPVAPGGFGPQSGIAPQAQAPAQIQGSSPRIQGGGAPVERASTGALDTARRTIQSGTNYLKGFFQ